MKRVYKWSTQSLCIKVDKLKVYMTDFFFICSIKSPQCADKCSKKSFFHSDFPFLCFDVPKASNFTSGGVQNRETKNRGLETIVTSIQDSKPREKQISLTFSYFLINNALLYHFLANWLAHNKKMTEKSVFREAWSPVLTSQSFPVSCFWSRGFEPHRKWNLTLLAHQNTGKENRYRKNCFATLISALGRFNRANKKNICHIHFKFLLIYMYPFYSPLSQGNPSQGIFRHGHQFSRGWCYNARYTRVYFHWGLKCVACRTGGLAGPARYTSAREARERTGRLYVGRWNERVRAKRCDAVDWGLLKRTDLHSNLDF